MKTKPNLSTGLLALQLSATIAGLGLLLLAYLGQTTLGQFRQRGVLANANVIAKLPGSSQISPYCVKVGFFTGSVLAGGELFMPTICDFVSGSLWNSLNKEDKVEALYLPDDPDKAILKASLDPANLAPVHKYETGLLVLIVAAMAAAARFWLARIRHGRGCADGQK